MRFINCDFSECDSFQVNGKELLPSPNGCQAEVTMSKVTAATLAHEALYICSPQGFVAYQVTSVPTDRDLVNMGMQRVVFKPVQLRPPVCPVNGAEGGDEPYWVRLPHRPDGTRLQLG